MADEPVWVERGFEHSEDDWQCSGCKSLNFAHREACFKCRRKRRRKLQHGNTLPAILPGNDDISVIQSKFLLIQGLEADFTSERLFVLVKQFIPSLKCTCLVVDKEQKLSKGFAFLQFSSLEESQAALLSLSAAGLFKSVQFGRDLCELAHLTSSSTGLVYWDSACELSIFPSFPDHFSIESRSTLSTAIKQTSNLNPKTTPPIIFTTTRPVKRLQLQKWTQNATQEAAVEPLQEPSMQQTAVEVEFLDFQFLVCKLCDECFESESALKLHAQQSQKHADKYDEFLRSEVESDALTHRDRAAERRKVFAIEEDEICIDETPQEIEEADSIGAKILKKMGWTAGKGLGKHETGIKEPLKAITIESIGAGLGAASLIDAEHLGTSYADRAKQGRMKRYKETQ